jgi:hypothetical protein
MSLNFLYVVTSVYGSRRLECFKYYLNPTENVSYHYLIELVFLNLSVFLSLN